MKCVIQWIDKQGKPTPDTNEAIGECWIISHPHIREDLTVYMVPESKKMPICAEHAKLLPDINRGYPVWNIQVWEKEQGYAKESE